MAKRGKIYFRALRSHTWYLIPHLVVLALESGDLSIEMKKSILNQLLEYYVPEELDHSKPEAVFTSESTELA